MTKKPLNHNLNKAKKQKNDEFYTKLSDIENELENYKDYFTDKIVYCNCDDPKKSNFFKYFAMNFKSLGLKKLVTTHYNKNGNSYKLEVMGDITNGDTINFDNAVKTMLTGNGDFRSEECVNVLKDADIVVTNPPFSLFRDFIDLLEMHKKDFIVIGSENAITYKNVFKLIKENRIKLGYTKPKEFIEPNGEIKKFGNICWYTNLDIQKTSDLHLHKTYKGNEKDYPKYDNYHAIEVSKVKDIPIDYDGVMGVPITYIGKHNPKKFVILGCDSDVNAGFLPELKDTSWDGAFYPAYINGKNLYKRIFIKRIKSNQT